MPAMIRLNRGGTLYVAIAAVQAMMRWARRWENGLVGKQVAAEIDGKGGDGQEPKLFDKEPGVVLKKVVEKDPSFVKGDGQAEGGEGEVQRLPLLVDHQGRGDRDGPRPQHV